MSYDRWDGSGKCRFLLRIRFLLKNSGNLHQNRDLRGRFLLRLFGFYRDSGEMCAIGSVFIENSPEKRECALQDATPLDPPMKKGRKCSRHAPHAVAGRAGKLSKRHDLRIVKRHDGGRHAERACYLCDWRK